MAKKKIPMTPAVRALEQAGVEYLPREYKYVDHGGTKVASQAVNMEEHAVVKTIVLEDETGAALFVLMHGDQEVSTKNLARDLGRKSISPCDPKKVNRLTGYQVGGTSPFGRPDDSAGPTWRRPFWTWTKSPSTAASGGCWWRCRPRTWESCWSSRRSRSEYRQGPG